MPDSESKIAGLITNTTALGEFLNNLTMTCVGWIATLGPYPEQQPDRVLLTVGYLSGPMVFGAEGSSPADAYKNMQRDREKEEHAGEN